MEEKSIQKLLLPNPCFKYANNSSYYAHAKLVKRLDKIDSVPWFFQQILWQISVPSLRMQNSKKQKSNYKPFFFEKFNAQCKYLENFRFEQDRELKQ